MPFKPDRSITAPVGLLGKLIMRALVLGVMRSIRASGVRLKPFSAVQGTGTDTPPARVTPGE
jgi:hypothetical protein